MQASPPRAARLRGRAADVGVGDSRGGQETSDCSPALEEPPAPAAAAQRGWRSWDTAGRALEAVGKVGEGGGMGRGKCPKCLRLLWGQRGAPLSSEIPR